MTHTLKAPSQFFAIGLFALTGLAVANPMANLVDCTDSFWAIACSEDYGDSNPEPVDLYGDGSSTPVDDVTDDVIIIGEPVRIDNDPVCAEIDGGFIVCHT